LDTCLTTVKSGFDKIRQGSCTLYIHKNFRNNNLERALLSGEQELQQRYRLTTVRSSKFSRVYKFTGGFGDVDPALDKGGVDKVVYFKQYLCRSVWDFIKHLFRASRARRAFKASLMLAENGFYTPTIVAMGECKSSFYHTENFLVTLKVENAKQIYQLIPNTRSNLTSEQLRSKRELIRAFGRTIGKMHADGIFHGDLRLGNVLARRGSSGWRFFFIDNERTWKFSSLPDRLRLKNLVQINMTRTGISRTDRLRFFKAYLEKNCDIQNMYKTLAGKVRLKTKRRSKKNKKV
jgi:hypothetical protein